MRRPLAFPHRERLRGNRNFEAVYLRGRRASHAFFTMVVLVTPQGGRHFGVSVSRKVGPAVVRNVVKRRLREVYRHHRARVIDGATVAVAVRPRAARARYRELEAAFLDLSRRLGILAEVMPQK